VEIAVSVLYAYRATKRIDGTIASEGSKPALCFRGKKYGLCLIQDYPIRVIRRRVVEFDKYRAVPVPLSHPEATEYPVALAVEYFQKNISKHGITVGAQKLLALATRVAKGETITETDLDENVFEDEEHLPSGYPLGVRPDGFKPDPEASQSSPATETPVQIKRRNRRAGPVTTVVEDGKPVAEGPPAAAKPPRTRKRGAESPMRLAVDYMKAEVIALGGLQEVTKDWRNQLFKRAAEKFGLSPNTCGVQWGRTLLPEMGVKKGVRGASAPSINPLEIEGKADAPLAQPVVKPARAKSKDVPAIKETKPDTQRRAPIRGEASPCNQAVAFMTAEVEKIGGIKEVTKEWRKQLFERAAAKFGLSPNTCNVQWGRKIAKK
jgi:hypothetical protein